MSPDPLRAGGVWGRDYHTIPCCKGIQSVMQPRACAVAWLV